MFSFLNTIGSNIVVFAIAITIAFGAGWKIKGWRDDSQYKDHYVQAISALKAQDLANQKMAQEYQSKVSDYQNKVDVLNGQIKNEVVEHSIYSECVLPGSGVQLLNTTVDSANKIKSSK